MNDLKDPHGTDSIVTLAVGDLVRYTRTGTVGEIIDITEEDGDLFAELDSTHLLYRIDTLLPISSASLPQTRKDPKTRDMKEEIKKEAVQAADIALSVTTTELDSACAGGG